MVAAPKSSSPYALWLWRNYSRPEQMAKAWDVAFTGDHFCSPGAIGDELIRPILIVPLGIARLIIVAFFILIGGAIMTSARAQCWACGLSSMGNAVSNMSSGLMQQEMQYESEKRLLNLQKKGRKRELIVTCREPVVPIISINGTTATVYQMKEAIADFELYQSGADDFQACIYDESQQMREADPAILPTLSSRANAVQAEKESLGNQLNVQIIAFRKAHLRK